MEDTRSGAPDIEGLIKIAANQYQLPPEILRALLVQESGGPNAQGVWNTGIAGQGGELGLGQFTPATAKAFGIDPTNPSQAIPAAALYIRQNLNRFGGNMDQALAAYNWGPGNVAKFGMAGAPASVRAYVAKIMGSKGVPAPPSGQGVGGAGTPGPGGALGATSPATSATPLASAVTPQMDPNMVALLGAGQQNGSGSLASLFGNAAQAWQLQQAKNVGLA